MNQQRHVYRSMLPHRGRPPTTGPECVVEGLLGGWHQLGKQQVRLAEGYDLRVKTSLSSTVERPSASAQPPNARAERPATTRQAGAVPRAEDCELCRHPFHRFLVRLGSHRSCGHSVS